MKAWLKVLGELLLVILLVPQVFVLCYFYNAFFHGGNQQGLLKAFALYGLTISWVSSPYLALMTLVTRLMLRTRVRWYVTLLASIAAGYLWLAAWNLGVYNLFTYGRAAGPILICSLLTTGYALARALYRENLPAPEKAKSAASDLSE